MSLGFVSGFLCAIGACKLKKLMNRWGVVDSSGITSLFFIPGFFAAVVSVQMLGAGLSIGIGVGAGVALGIILLFMKFREKD